MDFVVRAQVHMSFKTISFCPPHLEVERAGAQLMFWLKLDELSQHGLAHYFHLLASSGQLSSGQHFNVKISAWLSSAQQFQEIFGLV